MGLSGIFALFFSGIIHSHYSYHNIARESQVAVKKVIDLIAVLCETFMFAYLGLQASARSPSAVPGCRWWMRGTLRRPGMHSHWHRCRRCTTCLTGA